jgi:hypothetical protein
LTVTGLGAHIALPKVINGAEIDDVADAAPYVTYTVTTISDTAMTLDINFGAGYWRYELECVDTSCVGSADAPVPATDTDGDGVADNVDAFPNDASETADTDGDGVGDNADYAPNDPAVQTEPVASGNDNNLLSGNWKLSPVAGSLGVGPSVGDKSWWSIADDASTAGNVTDRSCLYDDVFSFNADGSFVNEMGDETWLEGWQNNGSEVCGTPVAPFDGSNSATYSYDSSAGTLTVSGLGAHIGLPKVINGAEIDDVADAAPYVTYTVTTISDTAMTLDINFGAGYWRYELECVDTSCQGSTGL